MITKFRLFEKLEIDEKTIRVENPEREWYIDFYFDEKDRLIWVDNKWHIKVPDWYGFVINKDTIRFWADRYDARSKIFYLLKNTTQKYNL